MFTPTISGHYADLIQTLIAVGNSDAPPLLDCFIASKQVRIGCTPTPDQRQFLWELINRHQSLRQPIKVETLWGGLKGYGLSPFETADLVDLMALKRYACLQQQVQTHYKPGIDVKIIIEDLTSWMLCEQPELCAHKIALYIESLRDMLAQLDMPFVSFLPESRLIEDHVHYRQTVHIYATRLAAKYRDSSVSLEDIGWNGPIIWDHYLPRAANKYPYLTSDQRLFKVALYLGNALARKNFGVVKSPDSIKISFAPYPKGVAPYLYNGRLEYKVKSCKHDKRSTPPWITYGSIKDNDWHPESVYDVLSSRWRALDFQINGVPCKLLIAA